MNKLLSLLCFILMSSLVSAADTTSGKPNIVLILADDMGYGELGCYGHPKFKTPHLDKLASQGVRLTQFNTPMPFCAPTRASLLTGRYPGRCGLTGNPAPDGGPQADALALPASEVLLPQLLKKAGYATGMVGKWHLGHKNPEYLPTHRGFDEYLGIPYSNDMRPVTLYEGDKPLEYPLVQATLTKRYTDRAVQFIDKNKDRPFFLYMAHAMPHKPLACSEEFYKKSGAGLYGDVLAELDAGIGRVLTKLDELKLADNTLVLFTSDNGPWYGGSSGGLRGMKGTTWEGGFRVPCIVRWPGKVPAGKVSEALGVMPDLFATSLAAAGVEPPAGTVIDGQDLLPTLAGQKPSPHDVIFGYQGAKLSTIRDAQWKLHVLPPRDRGDGKPGERWIDPRGPDGVTILAPYEQHQPTDYPGIRTGDETKAMSLFDLASDPAEQKDVAAKNPEVVARLKERLDKVAKNLAQAQPAPTPAKRPNIVYILADDLGINDLGCYGRKDHKTPHLDKLAREGLRFTNAYAAQSVCSPTRAALMTGKAPARLHLTTFLPGRPDCPSQKLLHPNINMQLPLEEKTIAEYLKEAGCTTGCFGKWHLGGKGFLPTDQGFDVFTAGPVNTKPSDTEGGKGEYALTTNAIQFIEANRDKPFFLYLPHNCPHIPFAAQEARIKENAGAFEPTYAAAIQTLDDSIGKLLAKLDELKLTDNTIVIFNSDNGGLHVPEGPHDKITHNTPYRAGKGFLYEGGIRVPLIVRWPGHVPAGKVVAAPVITTDMLPTLLDLVGEKVPDKLDGVSLAKVLTEQGRLAERPLFWHMPHYMNQGSRPSGAVRLGDWKLIKHYEDGLSELFNLKDDPSETNDVSVRESLRTKQMLDLLNGWLKEVDAQMNEPNPKFDAALHRPLYIDVDPSRYAPAGADAAVLDRMKEWRKQMNAVRPNR